ncbi:hypothetical protein AQUCO_00500593v1 [Aquilegia coerulea]|uniref:DYW domain-containing protein n=1 Tax=Aquilegia coerulea TaxID=218851 RepID=A0A2G5ESP4_AQUCA|nr:hypothetical protein AQUCO_00500593v1 [Aquilegia coerulea]
MIRTSVLPQSNYLILQEDTIHNSLEWKSKEQECLSFLKSCNCMEEFKQVHTQFIKLGECFSAGSLITACALSEWGSMDYACSIFRQFDHADAFTFNTMIRGYANECNSEAAILLYGEMQERRVQPDNFTYPPLLKACSRQSALKEGIQIHGHVLKHGLQTDLYVQNSLINMYGKCGQIKLSSQVFENMDLRSVASWSAVISSLARFGMWYESLRLLADMTKGGWKADESTLVSVLSSCSHLGVLDFGRCIHGSLLRNMFGLNVIVQTSLVDMYIKCGCLEKGKYIFQQMRKKNHLSYSVMISGLAIHGCTEDALSVFSDMLKEGLVPDETVYVGVLTACSRAGLVQEGWDYFRRMEIEHNIKATLEHYGCMVDLMARVGMLKEAYDLIKSMPIKPNDVVWRCLLSARKLYLDMEITEIVRKNLFQFKPHQAGDYLLLSNIYAQAHMWENVAEMRKKIVDRGLNQTPGFCLVEVQQKVHKFVSQDKSHPQNDALYEMIYQMEWQLRFDGYSADTSQVLHNVDEEEKRQRLRGHSQKLAIAFALIHTHQGSTIRIVRNLCMCSDCHAYTSLVSKIVERTIIVRDQNRFHQFKGGTCSCKNC